MASGFPRGVGDDRNPSDRKNCGLVEDRRTLTIDAGALNRELVL